MWLSFTRIQLDNFDGCKCVVEVKQFISKMKGGRRTFEFFLFHFYEFRSKESFPVNRSTACYSPSCFRLTDVKVRNIFLEMKRKSLWGENIEQQPHRRTSNVWNMVVGFFWAFSFNHSFNADLSLKSLVFCWNKTNWENRMENCLVSEQSELHLNSAHENTSNIYLMGWRIRASVNIWKHFSNYFSVRLLVRTFVKAHFDEEIKS